MAPAGTDPGLPLDSRPVSPALPGHRARALLAAVLAVLAVAAPAAAHASLVSSDPAEGSAVPVPDAITLTFDDDLDPAKSEFLVVASDGTTAATGHVTANARVMQAASMSLAWGAYQVRWTAVASDGDLTRGTVSFNVIQAGAVSVMPGEAEASRSPAASSPSGAAGTKATDVILPIVAGLVLVAIVATLVLRRGRAA